MQNQDPQRTRQLAVYRQDELQWLSRGVVGGIDGLGGHSAHLDDTDEICLGIDPLADFDRSHFSAYLKWRENKIHTDSVLLGKI